MAGPFDSSPFGVRNAPDFVEQEQLQTSRQQEDAGHLSQQYGIPPPHLYNYQTLPTPAPSSQPQRTGGTKRKFDSFDDMIKSPELSEQDKVVRLERLSSDTMDRMYKQLMGQYRKVPPTPSPTPKRMNLGQDQEQGDLVVATPSRMIAPAPAPALPAQQTAMTQPTYLPHPKHREYAADPNAPAPIYAAYTGHFGTSEEAKRHRKRVRIGPKSGATDIERVKRHGRDYWVRRIYNSMIDISTIADGASSIHYKRFTTTPTFDAADLEATAHHIFDAALRVHTLGWTRSTVYHKKVVRGKLTDLSENSVESRLARICLCLQQKKAVVDDAIRGGVTLALLCDNPEARGFTKMSNNMGNKRRGEKLKFAKEQGWIEGGEVVEGDEDLGAEVGLM